MAEHSASGFWDERFEAEHYVFGTEPNAFLRREAHRIPPASRVLAVADGEGRNGVFLAGFGHDVVATDFSSRGMAKARRLAAEKGVKLQTELVDLADYDWSAGDFDAIAAIFIQFADPAFRAEIFEGFAKALKPGGILLLEGYRPEQLEYGTGGPKVEEKLYTEEMLRQAFADWDIQMLNAYDAEVDEGPGHAGMSALIDLIAIRPEK